MPGLVQNLVREISHAHVQLDRREKRVNVSSHIFETVNALHSIELIVYKRRHLGRFL